MATVTVACATVKSLIEADASLARLCHLATTSTSAIQALLRRGVVVSELRDGEQAHRCMWPPLFRSIVNLMLLAGADINTARSLAACCGPVAPLIEFHKILKGSVAHLQRERGHCDAKLLPCLLAMAMPPLPLSTLAKAQSSTHIRIQCAFCVGTGIMPSHTNRDKFYEYNLSNAFQFSSSTTAQSAPTPGSLPTVFFNGECRGG
jgi:hypothetical protein